MSIADYFLDLSGINTSRLFQLPLQLLPQPIFAAFGRFDDSR